MGKQPDEWKRREFYEAIIHFSQSEEAQEYFYQVMDTKTGRKNPDGREETVRERILKVYAMLFCEDTGVAMGEPADVDDVADLLAALLREGTSREALRACVRIKDLAVAADDEDAFGKGVENRFEETDFVRQRHELLTAVLRVELLDAVRDLLKEFFGMCHLVPVKRFGTNCIRLPWPCQESDDRSRVSPFHITFTVYV